MEKGVKRIFMFHEGSAKMKDLLGGKGANLCEMTKMGIRVPEGFVITTECCTEFVKSGNVIPHELVKDIKDSLCRLEEETGKKFGGNPPLFISVRSGAPVSMPGMMDTLLNLGFNDYTLEIASDYFNNRIFSLESYSRLIEMFGDIVKKIPREEFKRIDEELDNNYSSESEAKSEEKLSKYKKLYFDRTGNEFPQNVEEQLMEAVESIFLSWNNSRAKIYRELNGIDENMGTAVNVQRMVFGNLNKSSSTGVAFSRNPATGENSLFGEYLIMAQGEDIVAGIRTPLPMNDMRESNREIYEEFKKISKGLEDHYRDMQDIEFTVEDGKLYILQTRNGKRAPFAALKMALDMISENLITKEMAVMRIKPKDISKLLKGNFEKNSLLEAKFLGKGLAGSAGVASGKAVFHSERITGADCILVRNETSPEDLRGMSKASGILTAKGGLTSHGAVVARGMGKCCVAGCSEMEISFEKSQFKLGGMTIKEGDIISIDGYTGNVYAGEIKIESGHVDDNFKSFLKIAGELKNMEVRMNADTPVDCNVGLEFGAEGIGLCRTEHMFFKEDRILAVREMILSKTLKERERAISKILPYQEEDFYKMIKLVGEKPINIRLLDPPLHEFLPTTESDLKKIGDLLGISQSEIRVRIESLYEHNPMLGHRGCRLAVTYPEIYRGQVKAISKAAIRCVNEGSDPLIEIMIPLVGHEHELNYVKKIILDEININTVETKFKYEIGTMIEVPRACVIADKLAMEADFFSFGTNDLTQTSYGLSRDDSAKFIESYIEKDIFDVSPFEVLDGDGVGKLMEIAIELGRKSNPHLTIGICGEHGGEEKSIEICDRLGLDYVSCSPYRVPAAIIAAAQVNLKRKL